MFISQRQSHFCNVTKMDTEQSEGPCKDVLTFILKGYSVDFEGMELGWMSDAEKEDTVKSWSSDFLNNSKCKFFRSGNVFLADK